MKRILVPCDFSANARQAYKSAIDLATASMGEIFVIHVMSFPILYESTFDAQPYSMDPLEIQKLEDNARETFERMKKDQPAPANIPVTFFLLHDNLLPTIRAFAEEKQIDLIVMGTNGSSGIKEFFIGSNTEKVVRFSAVPVIALRTTSTFNNIKNIVFPNTLEMNQTELMLRVKDLQKFFGATLHILLINTPTRFRKDQEAKEAILEFARHYKVENYTVNFRNAYEERNGIIDFVHETKADMLAMATHGRRGLAHLFVGSLTENVVNHVDCPIWTYSVHKK